MTTVRRLDQDALRHYYGSVLQSSADLKTNACCCAEAPATPTVRDALARIEDEVLSRFYGCGSPLPPLLEGCTVLDLGCGTGRDAFVASCLVGPKGRVIGVDMTEAQLDVARRNRDAQMRRFKYAEPNVEFRHGFIEDLRRAGIEDASVDVVISNCVINLSPDKESVFAEIHRVLKPGGELLFSDVFAGRRVPEALQADPVLHGECLAGALYREDFRRLMLRAGFPDCRVTASRRLELGDAAVEARIGMVDFYSDTIRTFKCAQLEDACEDYGQVVVYRGTIPDHPHTFALDEMHLLETGRAFPVCGNTASMVQESRYASHFAVYGDRTTHFGLFDCDAGLGACAEPAGSCC